MLRLFIHVQKIYCASNPSHGNRLDAVRKWLKCHAVCSTSGEQRISNFMLWDLAYTELFFTAKAWPDFAEEDLEEAVDAYALRQRRFGAQ